jgi:hypothetical protein
MPYIRAPSIRSLSELAAVLPALEAWIAGASFQAIYEQLTEAGVKISNRKLKIEDVVALCENGFGYDMAMVVASLSDLCETLHDDLHSAFSLLQKRIKHGLSDVAAIAFFEAGFADRLVASALAERYPDVENRVHARAWVRNEAEPTRGILSAYPAYFTSVLDEMLAG